MGSSAKEGRGGWRICGKQSILSAAVVSEEDSLFAFTAGRLGIFKQVRCGSFRNLDMTCGGCFWWIVGRSGESGTILGVW